MINIEEGKYYRTRDGRKVGPAKFVESQSDHPWNIPNETGPLFYYPDGTICLEYLEDEYNIVAEWKEEPMNTFKIGDKVKITSNTNRSTNQVGDIGVITYGPTGLGNYRVTVDGNSNIFNWTKPEEMELVEQEPLTMIEKPFGLLTKEEQEALKAWPHGWEIFTVQGHWEARSSPFWSMTNTYRAVPAPEVATKEMTVEEISEALGYPVKVVD